MLLDVGAEKDLRKWQGLQRLCERIEFMRAGRVTIWQKPYEEEGK